MKVGSRFTDPDGNKMIAVESQGCDGCHYLTPFYACNAYDVMDCDDDESEDGKSLIFIKENEK